MTNQISEYHRNSVRHLRPILVLLFAFAVALGFSKSAFAESFVLKIPVPQSKISVTPDTTTSYGIYLVDNQEAKKIASIKVNHVNADRVVATTSPDGHSLAYLIHYGDNGYTSLFVMNLSQTTSVLVAHSEDQQRAISSFAWSHSGDKIAYAQSMEGVYDNEMWITDLIGLKATKIAAKGVAEILGWTIDDQHLIIANTFSAYSGEDTMGRSIAGVSSVDVNGTKMIPLVLSQRSLDGTGAVFLRAQLLESQSLRQDLAIVQASGVYDPLPPDGTRLLISNLDLKDGATSIAAQQILSSTDVIGQIDLSPDGAKVGYTTILTPSLVTIDRTTLQEIHAISMDVNLEGPIMWNGDAMNAVPFENSTSYDQTQNSMDSVQSINGNPVRDNQVPYVHQVWDTKDSFAGYCACGPTSAAMVGAAYGKLSSHPITVSVPTPHTTDYGFYVTERFPGFDTRSIIGCNASTNPSGSRAYGLYGEIIVSDQYIAGSTNPANGGAGITGSFTRLGLSNQVKWSPTLANVKDAINQDHLVILSFAKTGVTRGHYLVIKGYTDQSEIIVNDPFGNFNAGRWGQSRNGENIKYAWSQITSAGEIIEVTAALPKYSAQFVGQSYNVNMIAGSVQDVSLTIKNSGSAVWDDNTKLAARNPTSDPNNQDGAHQLCDSTWLAGCNRIQSAGSVATGQTKTFNFKLRAPTTPGSYRINFGLVQEGKQWFGAPFNGEIWFQVNVTPQTLTCPASQYKAEYFNNRDLAGTPVFARCENYPINTDWGTGGPGNGVGNDNFSVRWTGNAPFNTGTYRFVAGADDGIRVKFGGQYVINEWRDQAYKQFSAVKYVVAGTYPVVVEFYEAGGGARAYFHWENASVSTTNLTLNRPVTGATQESSAYAPRFGNDGNAATRWSSNQASGAQWYVVDLGEFRDMDRVRIRWETAYAKGHFVGVSDDGVHFTGYNFSISSSGLWSYSFGKMTGRYIAIVMTDHAVASNGVPYKNFSFYEFEAYNGVWPSSLSAEASTDNQDQITDAQMVVKGSNVEEEMINPYAAPAVEAVTENQ